MAHRMQTGRWPFRVALPQQLLNEVVYHIDIGTVHYCRDWNCEPGVKKPSIYVEIQGSLSDSPYWMSRRPGILAPVLNCSVGLGDLP